MLFCGYLFTVANYVCYCCSRFMKKKKMMLLLDLVSKILMSVALYFLGSLSGAYIFIAVLFMLIVANIKERLNKKWFLAYAFFQFLYLLILWYTYIGISSVLVVLTVSVTLFSIWWLSPQKMRIVGAFNGLTFLAYQISIQNWVGLLEIFVIISNFISYYKSKKQLS